MESTRQIAARRVFSTSSSRSPRRSVSSTFRESSSWPETRPRRPLASRPPGPSSIFWGLWLFPFGILVVRSGFIPRVLGILVWIAGSAYLVEAVATLVFPRAKSFVDSFAMLLEAGELPIIFWLAIRGAKERPAGMRTVAA